MKHERMIRRWHDRGWPDGWRVLTMLRQRWAEADGDQRAAAFAFYLLLSLFPIAILLVTAGSLFVEREVAVREFMLYKTAPSRRTRFGEVWLGALIVTVFLWLGGILFLIYATNFARFNVLYGSLGGIVAFLLWIYLSSCACVFGICLNAARAEIRTPSSEPPDLSSRPKTKLT